MFKKYPITIIITKEQSLIDQQHHEMKVDCRFSMLLYSCLLWSVFLQPAKKSNTNFGHGLALYLQKEFQPASVLEYGRNTGPNIDFFHRKCNSTIVVAHLQESNSSRESSVFAQYDVVYYFGDVTEHDELTMKKIADFLAAHTSKWLIFRFDPDDIEEEWQIFLQERGLIFMPKRTTRLRLVAAVDSGNSGQSRSNYSVFVNERAFGGSSASNLDDSAYAMRQHLGIKLKLCMHGQR